ncbi:NEDD4-binding protein 1 [Lampetra planeri]
MANRDGGMQTAVQHGGGGSNGGSDGDYMEEFTVPASREALVNNVARNLQQIFFVCMTLVTTPGDNFSWIKLTGKSLENVQRAKEFVVGLCGEGLQVEQRFPPGLQCVYEGLAGRFLRALAWDSRADVSVTGVGRLTIRGGTEAVLLAQTRVQHFCDCCRETDAEGRGAAAAATAAPGEADSLAKRRFNRLVEENGGKYGTELLLLPVSIKRDLLELLDAAGAHATFSRGPPDRTRGSFVLSARGTEAPEAPGVGGGGGGGNRIRVRMPTEGQRTYGKGREDLSREENDSPVTELSSSFTSALGKAEAETPETEEAEECAGKPLKRVKNPSVKRKTSDSESTVSGQMKKHSPANVSSSRGLGKEEGRAQATAAAQATPEPERELKYLVNFFSTMGYDPELVRSVVLEMGQQTEASEILDRLQEKATLVTAGEQVGGDEESGSEDPQEGSYATHWVMEAAMSLGYTRDEVGDVCRAVGTDPRSVLKELHRMGKRAAPAATAAEPGAESAHREQQGERQGGPTEALARVFSRGVCSNADRAEAQATWKKPGPEASLLRSHGGEGVARGGPVNGAARLPRGGVSSSSSSSQRARFPSAEADDLETDGTGAPPPATSRRPGKKDCIVISDDANDVLHVRGPADGAARKEATKWHVEQPGPRQECTAVASTSRVAAAAADTTTTTGSSSNLQPTELYLLGLSKPYKLYLPSEPGRESVRHVIVDGSNVAMAHGLNRYFSCRGMALCVEYFWKRGHRNITVFVPQYRTCRDPSIKEQHLLTKLEELGLLSFTPCRMFEGRRITTHDDRFMLHLADNTDGIIVTNDNFREFTTELISWREIVKTRILPYTFVGDVFMVPDDPLGRHGPRLDQFLTKPKSTRLMHHNPAAYQAKTFPLRLPSAAAATVAGVPGFHSMNDCGRPRPTNDLQDLRRQLLDIFPGEEEKVQRVLQQYPAVNDLNLLSDLMLDV